MDKEKKEVPNKDAQTTQNSNKITRPDSRWTKFQNFFKNPITTNWIMGMATIAIAIATIFYAIYASKQWAIMSKQLELTDRPWIKVDLKTISPLRFISENTRFTVDVRITMKNIGRSVATKVRYNYGTFLVHVEDVIDEPLKQQKIILDKLSSTKPNRLEEGESIFPDEERVNASNAGAVIMEDALGPKERPKPTNIIPVVVGCVEYQFPSSTDRHYTCFNYRIVRRNPSKGVYWGVIHVGEDLPSENVFLDPNNWGGRLTN